MGLCFPVPGAWRAALRPRGMQLPAALAPAEAAGRRHGAGGLLLPLARGLAQAALTAGLALPCVAAGGSRLPSNGLGLGRSRRCSGPGQVQASGARPKSRCVEADASRAG